MPDFSSADDAFHKIERLLSVRDRSSAELRERLSRDGFEEPAIEEALNKAQRCGFVDDDRYADLYVRSRMASGRGLEGVRRDLAARGIDARSSDPWADAEADYDAEIARALDVLQRKPPRAKNMREAAFRKLVQRGFSASVASSAARQWHEGQGTCF